MSMKNAILSAGCIKEELTMQPLRALLSLEQSDLARTLRLSLWGLRATIAAALEETPRDPGMSACRALIQELDELLYPIQEPSVGEEPSDWNTLFEPNQECHSTSLQAAFIARSELQSCLQQLPLSQFQSVDDAVFWNAVQRLLLRVPEPIAAGWRMQIQTVLDQIGAVETRSETACVKIAASRNEVIYPGLSGTVRAPGLCLSTQVPLAQWQQETDLVTLADTVAICLHFIEVDPLLHQALKAIDRSGIRLLDSEQAKANYSAVLIDRFNRVKRSQSSLKAQLDLDEAINSLVYLPPAHPDSSWWGQLQQEARRSLIAKARESGVQVRQLWGLYANVYSWSKDDLQVQQGGIPGEVIACLRVYANLEGEELPGRVLFCPRQ
jgi:hypothetical protein